MSENWNDAGCITPSTTTAHPWSKALTHATLYSLCPGKVMWSFMRGLVRIGSKGLQIIHVGDPNESKAGAYQDCQDTGEQ